MHDWVCNDRGKSNTACRRDPCSVTLPSKSMRLKVAERSLFFRRLLSRLTQEEVVEEDRGRRDEDFGWFGVELDEDAVVVSEVETGGEGEALPFSAGTVKHKL